MSLPLAILGVSCASTCWFGLMFLWRKSPLGWAYYLSVVAVAICLLLYATQLTYIDDHRGAVWILAANSGAYFALLLFLKRPWKSDLVRARFLADSLTLIAVGFHIAEAPTSYDLDDNLMWYLRAPIEIPAYLLTIISRSPTDSQS